MDECQPLIGDLGAVGPLAALGALIDIKPAAVSKVNLNMRPHLGAPRATLAQAGRGFVCDKDPDLYLRLRYTALINSYRSTVTHLQRLLAAGPRRIMISTFSDRRFYVWAKMGGVAKMVPPGPTTFRSGRTFGRVTTPGSVPFFDDSQLPNSFH